jgi:hypothetical protein
MTSVYWNILKRCICISTDAGRMYRPLLIVDYDVNTYKSELRINKILKEKKLSWKEFIHNKKSSRNKISIKCLIYLKINLCRQKQTYFTTKMRINRLLRNFYQLMNL